MVTILTRQIGCKQPLLEDWSITFPPEWGQDKDPLTLRQLLIRLVHAEIARWRQRRKRLSLLSVLTRGDLEEGHERGRFISGGQLLGGDVNEDTAIGLMLQAFLDGLFMVIIDEQPQTDIDRQVHLTPDSTITLLRLMMLHGE